MSNGLRRSIGLRDLTLGVIGSVIGSGIFLVPGGVLAQAQHSVGLSLLVWLGGGLLTLIGALTYSELGAMNPGTGGLYLYLRDAFGRLPAFLYGWAMFLAISAGAIAVLTSVSAQYIGRVVPLSPIGSRLVAVGLIAGLTVVNVRGTTISVRFMSLATAVKVAALAFLIVALPLAVGLGAFRGPIWPDHFDLGVLQGFGAGMLMVLWAYEGWQYSTFIAGEVTEPQRNLPRGLAMGALALMVIYVLTNVAYLSALGPAAVASTTTVAADAVAATFGPGPAALITIPILISMISAAHFVVLTSSRVYFAMAQDGLFFARFAQVHPRYGTPAAAIVGASVAGAALAMIGTVGQLLGYVVFVGWIFYGLGALALFRQRRIQPDAVRPFRVPGYPVLPALFVVAAVALVANTLASQPPLHSAAALGLLGLGIPVYLGWQRYRPAAKPGPSSTH